MDTNLLIAIAAAILLLLVILKFAAKAIIKITLTVLISLSIGIFVYFNYFGQNDNLSQLKNFSPKIVYEAYCDNPVSKTDIIKCECIAKPVYEDMKSRLSEDELEDMKSNKIKFIKELAISFANKKDEIKKKLKEKKAENLFDEFKKDISNGNILKRIKLRAK